ncbi:hypothetical protein BGZ99_001593 [Dissophora globulifera]|uniref:DOMON domain-containing protein n=1 Tax=Dissophora globulifera TaxID=979702 RepID=A0A9P6UY05_9FUNG|nr:hypothetical protein BGZ99_001593 [Dissophora globulifera]
MTPNITSTRRRVLITLGLALFLVHAHIFASAEDAPAAAPPLLAATSRVHPSDELLSSTEITIDRRPVVQIPVVNGVAQPLKPPYATQEREHEHGSELSQDTEIETVRWFEMDHQVPAVADLEAQYPNQGRTALSSCDEPLTEGKLPGERKDGKACAREAEEDKKKKEDASGKVHNHAPLEPVQSIQDNVAALSSSSSDSPQNKEERHSTESGEKSETQLLNQYSQDQQQQQPQQKQQQQKPLQGDSDSKVVKAQDGEFVVVHKLNKNYELFDKEVKIKTKIKSDVDGEARDNEAYSENGHKDLLSVNAVPRVEEGGAEGGTGSRGDRTRNRVLAHHHHHHTSNTHQQQWSEQDEQHGQEQQQVFMQDNSGIPGPSLKDAIVVDGKPEISTALNRDGPINSEGKVLAFAQEEDMGEGEEVNEIAIPEDGLEDLDDEMDDDMDSSPLPQAPAPVSSPSPPALPESVAMPEALRTRGLVPSVQGARHCTPQFCVNVTLSEEGNFATFHIERPLANTGWISLGIGYAMTMADLLIFWPNQSPVNGGGPRGAVLSRRTSHAYVEPQVVGHATNAHNPLGDNVAEASLYPPNEYVLHNANPGASVAAKNLFPDDNTFVVQFTRPIRTRNQAYKLTPGEEQDFCWAYSPKPISPDSVADPAAHITQHLTVGSFAMDVAANQPHLKDVVLKQKEENDKLDVAEKERTKLEREKSNKKLKKGNIKDSAATKPSGNHLNKHHGDTTAKSSHASTRRISSLLAQHSFSYLVVTTLLLLIG